MSRASLPLQLETVQQTAFNRRMRVRLPDGLGVEAVLCETTDHAALEAQIREFLDVVQATETSVEFQAVDDLRFCVRQDADVFRAQIAVNVTHFAASLTLFQARTLALEVTKLSDIDLRQ